MHPNQEGFIHPRWCRFSSTNSIIKYCIYFCYLLVAKISKELNFFLANLIIWCNIYRADSYKDVHGKLIALPLKRWWFCKKKCIFPANKRYGYLWWQQIVFRGGVTVKKKSQFWKKILWVQNHPTVFRLFFFVFGDHIQLVFHTTLTAYLPKGINRIPWWYKAV